jgi:hypothetical protein
VDKLGDFTDKYIKDTASPEHMIICMALPIDKNAKLVISLIS